VATFAQLKQRAKNLALADDDSEAQAAVNDALVDIVVSCQLKVGTATGTLTSGQSVYTMSGDFGITDFGALQYMEYLALGSTQSYILEPISADEIIALNATNPIGATRQYAFLGLDTIRTWPEPQTTGDTMTIYYAQTPATLVYDADEPTDIPSQWQWLVTIGAAMRLADAVGEDQNLSNALDAKFALGMDKFQKFLTRRGGRTARRVQYGYLRTPRRPFHDNSTYYSSAGR
jgi:hypothetical protein